MAQNNDNSAAYTGIAIVGAVLWIGFLFIFALVVFVTGLLTLWALWAWKKPRTLFGNTVTPQEAREFVGLGLIGGGLALMFTVFCGLIFDLRLTMAELPWAFIVGYCLGSFGILMIRADAENKRQKAEAEQQRFSQLIEMQPPQDRPQSPASRPNQPEPSEEAPPFRFASWNDDEELRK